MKKIYVYIVGPLGQRPTTHLTSTRYEVRIRALEADKADLTSRNEKYQERIRVLEGEKADLNNRNEDYQHQIKSLKDQNHALEAVEANLADRNEENQRQIQDLIRTYQYESERLGTADSSLEEQINVSQLEKDNFASQIEDLTAKNQQLVIDAEDQSQREQQLHWVLVTACKERTSLLRLALDFAVKIIEQWLQSEPWFSTSQFDAARIIDSRSSGLPEGTRVIADRRVAGVVLIVQGTDIRLLEACDVVIKQQEYSGFQLVFTGGLDLPALQLLPNSWPGVSRWSILSSWASTNGRINVVMKDGDVYEPLAL